MPGYISPMDLLAPYLQPLTANINQGIGTGINLLNLQHGMEKDRVNAELVRQQIAASKANEARTEALTEKMTAEEARQKTISEAMTKLYDPTITPVYGKEYTPPTPSLPDPNEPLQINPFTNLAGLSPGEIDAAKIAAIPTGTKTVTPNVIYQQKMAIPGLTFKEQMDLGKQEQIEMYQNEMNRIKDEYNNARTDVDRQKIQNQWDMLALKIDSLEKIAANKPDKVSTVAQRMKEFNADRIARGFRPFNYEQYQRYESKLYGPLGRMGIDPGASSGKKSYEAYE